MTRELRRRPDAEPAHHFEAAFCGEPNCGLHIIACRENGTPICEIVMSPDSTLGLIEYCQRELYAKAAKRDE